MNIVEHRDSFKAANLFDGRFYVEPNRIGRPGFFLSWGRNRVAERRYFPTLDELMTFLAGQAIARMQEGRA